MIQLDHTVFFKSKLSSALVVSCCKNVDINKNSTLLPKQLITLVNVPMKECISFCGFSAYIVALTPNRSFSWASFCVVGTASRNFQSVSPSNWSVRTNTEPLRSDVLKRIKSAGTLSSLSTIIKSPT